MIYHWTTSLSGEITVITLRNISLNIFYRSISKFFYSFPQTVGVSDIFPLLTSEYVVILIIFSSCQTNKLVWISLLKERNFEVTASFIFLLSHRQQSPPAAAGITITGAPASQNIHQDFIVFFFFKYGRFVYQIN